MRSSVVVGSIDSLTNTSNSFPVCTLVDEELILQDSIGVRLLSSQISVSTYFNTLTNKLVFQQVI